MDFHEFAGNVFAACPLQTDLPKPTDGLEYTYARKSSAYNPDKKDIAHIWELSGGEDLADEVLKSEHVFLGQKQVSPGPSVLQPPSAPRVANRLPDRGLPPPSLPIPPNAQTAQSPTESNGARR